MARKRKNPDGTLKETKPGKAIRRGIVKWPPPHIEGEDQTSHNKHVIWLQQEFKKRDKRYNLVSHKMELTYSFAGNISQKKKNSLAIPGQGKNVFLLVVYSVVLFLFPLGVSCAFINHSLRISHHLMPTSFSRSCFKFLFAG